MIGLQTRFRSNTRNVQVIEKPLARRLKAVLLEKGLQNLFLERYDVLLESFTCHGKHWNKLVRTVESQKNSILHIKTII